MTPANADAAQPSPLALLQTCRLVHDEAFSFFYSLNHLKFRFVDIRLPGLSVSTRETTSNFSTRQLAAIERITMVVDLFVRLPSVCRLICYCTCLKELRLEVLGSSDLGVSVRAKPYNSFDGFCEQLLLEQEWIKPMA